MAIPVASFTVNDGATPPVAQTFTIADRTGLLSTFRNAAASLVRGMKNFSHEVKLGGTAGAANRALIQLRYPVEGLNSEGQTTVLRTSLFKVEANFSPDSTTEERTTAYGLFLNALAQADVKEATIKLVSLG